MMRLIHILAFLHSHVMGTNVFGPTKHRNPPDVDLESLILSANDASEYRITSMSSGLSPQYAARVLVLL